MTFEDITVTANTDGMCQCALRSARGEKERRIMPEFVLIRQKPITEHDRTVLLGFKMAGLPSSNSLHSLYNFLHAPWVLAQLSRIQARVGKGTSFNIIQLYSVFMKLVFPKRTSPIRSISNNSNSYVT